MPIGMASEDRSRKNKKEYLIMNPAIAARRRQKAAQARASDSNESSASCSSCPEEINVAPTERWVSLFGGGVLVTCGLLRGSTSGLALAGLGAALAYRGFTGHCHLYQSLGYSTADGE
jgi:uncharacterized membrane protein